MLLFSGCDNVSGSSEQLSPEELILGSWKVSAATIDNQSYLVTTPGFGQMQAIIDESKILYIYPQVNAFGVPTAQNDTLTATWSFNVDHTIFTLSNPQDGSVLLVWDIMNLGVGLLKTSYQAQSAANESTLSTYELTYSLVK